MITFGAFLVMMLVGIPIALCLGLGGVVYIAASGNPLIAQSAQLHWHHIRRAMGAVLQVSTMRESIWDEHDAIANAIARGDAEQAEALIRQHAEDAGRNLANLLTQALFKNHTGDTP